MKGIKMKIKIFMVLSCLVFLGACSTTRTPDPIGFGPGVNDLKRSPCACLPIEQKIPLV